MHSISKWAIGLFAVFALFSGAGFAYASGLTPNQVTQIINLLQSFNVDTGTLSNVQTALGGASITAASTTTTTNTGSTTTGAAASCANISNDLSAGSVDFTTGGDVIRLQQFLGVSPVTGFYGPLTEQAVENYQASHGIVSSGDPASTGYGAVGPKTFASISCNGQANTTTTTTTATGPTATTSTVAVGAVLSTAVISVNGTVGNTIQNVSEAATLSTCQQTARANTGTTTCTWNGTQIYSSSPSTTATSGVISADGCVIAAGQSTCPLTVAWTAANTNAGLVDIDVLVPGRANEIDFLTAQTGNSSFVWNTANQANFGPGSYTFKLYNHNPSNTSSNPVIVPAYPTPLAISSAVTVTCASGSAWNTTSKLCAASTATTSAAPVITSFTLNNTNGNISVTPGTSVSLAWTSANTTGCTINYGTTQSVAANSATPLVVNTTGTGGSFVYNLVCTGTGGSTVTTRALTVGTMASATTPANTNTNTACPSGYSGLSPYCVAPVSTTLAQCTNAIGQREDAGQSFSCSCPANYNTAVHSIWGAGTYTDDSDICTAAIQAGVVTAATGGAVDYSIQPGQSSYQSTYQNGVGSNTYGTWFGSFSFPKGTATPSPANTPAPTVAVSANPSIISFGQTSTLSWSSANASSCSSAQFATGGATSGTVQIPYAPSSSANTSVNSYTVTCAGAGGTGSASANIGQSAQTNAGSGPSGTAGAPFIAALSVGPAAAGGTFPLMTNAPFVLSWTTVYMSSCSLSIPSGITSAGTINGSNTVGAQNYQGASSGTYSFSISCVGNDSKTYTSSVAATLVAPAAASNSSVTTAVLVSPNTFTPGSSAPLTIGTNSPVFFTLTHPQSSDSTSYYAVDFGDGSAAAGGGSHTYSTSGVYTAKLHGPITNTNCPNCSLQQALNTPTVATSPAITVTSPQVYLTAAPVSGVTSVTVTFSSWVPTGASGGPYTLNFSGGNANNCSVGEGCVAAPTCTPNSSGVCTTPATTTHTYTWKNAAGDLKSPDNYSALLTNGAGQPLGQTYTTVSCVPGSNGLCPTPTSMAPQQTQVASALSAVQQLLGITSSAVPAVSPVAPSASCVNLSSDLVLASTDQQTNGQVSELQQFLGINPTTGYFGSQTQQALQAWQASHNVVSSGTPDTTGYGDVGPTTRAAMACK